MRREDRIHDDVCDVETYEGDGMEDSLRNMRNLKLCDVGPCEDDGMEESLRSMKNLKLGMDDEGDFEESLKNMKRMKLDDQEQSEAENIRKTVNLEAEDMEEDQNSEEESENLGRKLQTLSMEDKEEVKTQEEYKRVSSRYMKEYRRRKWEKIHGWREEDLDRKIDSLEARPEQLQNFEEKMVIIGSDVVALYPNLDIRRVVKNVKEAVRMSGTTWREIDYLEGARYLALNWSAEECRRSKLSRILPRRRKKGGSRPTVRGQGPKGKERGDQEQWTFPKIVLEDWEKEEIVSEVISLATAAMFRNHYYSFGGKVFHQESGGPIGLRGTCSIARLVMQLYDHKWSKRMVELGITVWLMVRYMDDTRILLPEIKPG